MEPRICSGRNRRLGGRCGYATLGLEENATESDESTSVLLTRISLGGVLLGMEASAAELLEQAKRERGHDGSSRAAT